MAMQNNEEPSEHRAVECSTLHASAFSNGRIFEIREALLQKLASVQRSTQREALSQNTGKVKLWSWKKC
jgi:hypothetical protein